MKLSTVRWAMSKPQACHAEWVDTILIGLFPDAQFLRLVDRYLESADDTTEETR